MSIWGWIFPEVSGIMLAGQHPQNLGRGAGKQPNDVCSLDHTQSATTTPLPSGSLT